MESNARDYIISYHCTLLLQIQVLELLPSRFGSDGDEEWLRRNGEQLEDVLETY